MNGLQYLVDNKGKPIAVLIDLKNQSQILKKIKSELKLNPMKSDIQSKIKVKNITRRKINFIDYLLNHPIKTRNFFPLTREKIYE